MIEENLVAKASDIMGCDQELATFWATPIKDRRGLSPWMNEYKYYENFLVRARVSEIKKAMLAYEHVRVLPHDAARGQGSDNSPVHRRQWTDTPLAIYHPEGQQFTFARLKGHDWSQIRGGLPLGEKRAFSNESLALYLSKTLATKAFIHGYEHVSGCAYHELVAEGSAQHLDDYSDDQYNDKRDAVLQKEGIFDPDVYWEVLGRKGKRKHELLFKPLTPTWEEDDKCAYRRRDFAEVTAITVQALLDEDASLRTSFERWKREIGL